MKCAVEILQGNTNVRVVIDPNKKPSNEHARPFNLQEASEVSVIIPGEDEHHLSVALFLREGGVRNITELHRSYDALHYANNA